MSQLIALSQRIKAIETIKKITHAMRLISMSLHTRLRNREEPLNTYKLTIQKLFYKLNQANQQWHNAILYPLQTPPSKTLIILIGSQKGLCGNFNTMLFPLFENTRNQQETSRIIVVGKKAIEYVNTHNINTLETFDELSSRTISPIATRLIRIIFDEQQYFTSVIVCSNILKSFFVRQPFRTHLIPFTPAIAPHAHQETIEYELQQPVFDILDLLARQTIEVHIQHLLFQSLLAEQASRFLSMDSATRNADRLLDAARLNYNKLRQAKITKELSELTGSIV